MQASLFPSSQDTINIGPDAYLLAGFCKQDSQAIWQVIADHIASHPPQQMMTPMGYLMSVKTTSMGAVGWVSDRDRYGYSDRNPETQLAWPPIPTLLTKLATRAALAAGYADFVPDTCLINLYAPKAKMGLHQDKDERDFAQPIVSVSLGLPATFLFGGASRKDAVKKVNLTHGDIVVFGGQSRRYYHGVAPLRAGQHPLLGAVRCNLTFRKAR